jgi:hypothetical protein
LTPAEYGTPREIEHQGVGVVNANATNDGRSASGFVDRPKRGERHAVKLMVFGIEANVRQLRSGVADQMHRVGPQIDRGEAPLLSTT